MNNASGEVSKERDARAAVRTALYICKADEQCKFRPAMNSGRMRTCLNITYGTCSIMQLACQAGQIA